MRYSTILLLNFMFLFFKSQAQVPTDSLIGYWPFNNNANDESGFGNHGTVIGANLTSDRFGNPNSAYKFDGVNDYIESSFNFDGAQTSFSVSYWFKLDPTYNFTNAKIFHFQESLTTYEIANDFLTNKKLNFFISGSVNNPNGINFSNDTIAKDMWYHVVTNFDFNSKVKQIYINGVLDTNSVSLNIINRLPISRLRIGARIMNDPGGSLEYFKGIIDDFRIYKRVLTPNEVNNLYNECNNNQICIGGIINKYSAVSSISCNNITVENPQLFSVGDRVLIIQMQGAKTDTSYSASFGTILDYASAGNYEFNTIKAISGSNIILEFAFKKTYDLKGSVQLIYVPVYDDVIINQRLTGKQWDGKTGGVIAIEASGNITMNVDIDASGLGFRGGKVKQNELSFDRCQPSIHYGSFLDNKGGQKGEGIAKWDSLRILNKGAWTNGGGGGNDHNSGGGGGGNGGKGGRGGKLYYEPNDQPNCQGGHGQPGNLLAPSNNKLFLGGGGGAGHDNDLVGSSGAEGGGIVIVKATNIIGNNFEINANGSSALPAQNDGAGGGGSGGTIAISAQNIINCILNAVGGNGGNNTWTYANQCVGTGGGGGGGIVLYNGNLNNSDISVANGFAGKLSHAVIPGPCSNINFEAENGLPGRSQSGLVLAYSDQIIGNSDTVYQEICQGAEYILPDGTSVTESGIYSVSISGSGGCDSLIITDLKVVATPKSIQLASEKICPGDTIVLSVNIKPDEVITWPDGSSGNSYIVTSPGIYSIVVSNECGSTTSDINILLDECNTCGIFIPNAFTPNADGINDKFKPNITCEEVEPYLFRIYNRWNELVFETNEPVLGWDGIYKGQQQPTDSYIYIVSYFNPLLKKEIIKKGVVTKLK